MVVGGRTGSVCRQEQPSDGRAGLGEPRKLAEGMTRESAVNIVSANDTCWDAL